MLQDPWRPPQGHSTSEEAAEKPACGLLKALHGHLTSPIMGELRSGGTEFLFFSSA